MHDAVEHGGEDDAEEGDQDEATKKGVTCGEKLGGRIGQLLPVHRPHSAHEHGRLQHGIGPGKITDTCVPNYADSQGDSQNRDGDAEVGKDAPDENVVWGHGLVVVLKGHPLVVDRLNCQTKEAVRPMGKISEEVGSVFRIWDIGYRKQSISCLRYPISSHPVGGSGRSWIRTSEGVEPADLQSAPFGHFGIRPGNEETRKKAGGGQKGSPGCEVASVREER